MTGDAEVGFDDSFIKHLGSQLANRSFGIKHNTQLRYVSHRDDVAMIRHGVSALRVLLSCVPMIRDTR